MAPAAKPIDPANPPSRRESWSEQPLDAREWVVDTATGRVVRRTCRPPTPATEAIPPDTQP